MSDNINPRDLIIETYRPAGGDLKDGSTAVKITHFPTGIFVECDKHKLYHKNRDEAFDNLLEKLNDR